jgi:hypothetical protein
MLLTRRSFGAHAAALLSTTALVACGAQNAATVAVNAFSAYASAVLSGLSSIANSSTIAADLGTDAEEAVNNALADATKIEGEIVDAANTIVAATTSGGWATEIQTDANTVLNFVENLTTLPAGATTVITAIRTVLPILLSTAGVIVAAAAPSTGMSVNDAMATLKAPPKF